MRMRVGLLLACVSLVVAAAPTAHARDLRLDERVAAQKAIEQVYWSHRIWPKENPGPKPPPSAVLTDAAIRARVEDSLRMSALLDSFWHQPLRGEQLQTEIERMAKQSKSPAMLRELFAALHDDPFLIAECLARPALAQRRVEAAFASVSPTKRAYGDWSRQNGGSSTPDAHAIEQPSHGYSLPAMPLTTCTDDTWTPTAGSEVPDKRINHTAVWTGSEMIVWGGSSEGAVLGTGGRYNPSTDSWVASSLSTDSAANVPDGRESHTAVWTGSEMIVWGGRGRFGPLKTGGRYNPSTDSWATSSLTTGSGANVPAERTAHAAVWTGSRMIIWGGSGNDLYQNGGQYDPSTDSWASSSLSDGSGPNVPSARAIPTVIWTGSEMIVWGGEVIDGYSNDGGRYDPSTDTWASSSLLTGAGANVPAARSYHTAVWTGSEMIVWGGGNESGILNTGGRYAPLMDSWAASALTAGSGANVPGERFAHTAVWTGSEMIIWGGFNGGDLDTGGRFDPATDSWVASSLLTGSGANVAPPRAYHTAIWTGSEMIVWGGRDNNGGTGGRYDPSTDSWSPSSLVTGANVPRARAQHTAVWTGSEMIIWGVAGTDWPANAGWRYNPATGSWTEVSFTAEYGPNTPPQRSHHTAVWTGLEMIVWGGLDISGPVNVGGRYNPSTDSWEASSLRSGSGANVPEGRSYHTAVWTGTEMIVWGGSAPGILFNTGGRYDPSLDSWAASSLTGGSGANIPAPRALHTAVWTGSEMIIWGGDGLHGVMSTGGRYDPSTDSWAASSLTGGSGANVPARRASHTAVWTGSEMIVWGGATSIQGVLLDTGGRYDPATDSWATSSLTNGSGVNVPGARFEHTVTWTGSEMIVWGGLAFGYSGYLNTGGRYNPSTDAWAASSLTNGSGANVPTRRSLHTAVWTGSAMIVWSGGYPVTHSGGVYCAQFCAPLTWYQDADGDAHGSASATQSACTQPEGYVAAGDDCDDTDPVAHPGASEACDGTDNDCDGVIDNDGNVLCDDGNGCTDDSCDPATGCTHAPSSNGDVYFSTASMQFLAGFTAGDGDIVRISGCDAGMAPVVVDSISARIGIDALDVQRDGSFMFSVRHPGGIHHTGGYLHAGVDDIYQLVAATGEIRVAVRWRDLGINMPDIDALGQLADGSILFSTSVLRGVRHAGGFTVLRPQNVYRLDPATRRIGLFFDGVRLGLRDLDGFDAHADGSVSFSTATNALVRGVYVKQQNAYTIENDGRLSLSLDGERLGLRSLDDFSF